MTVVTVNKVQDVYATPVYEFTPEHEGDVLEVMNQYMRDGRDLDVEGYYARQQFNSVHIGDFKLSEAKEEARQPKVAVVMPVYNQKPEYLREAVESVLGQTYKNFTLIIVDDGSDSPATIEALTQLEHPSIVIHRLERNSGVAQALN